jgi:hypothetical protein
MTQRTTAVVVVTMSAKRRRAELGSETDASRAMPASVMMPGEEDEGFGGSG